MIIITTREELRAVISKAFANVLSTEIITKELSDNITLEAAVQLLKEFGFPTSKAKIYKLTSSESMPLSKYGNKLIFSRKELLEWAEIQTNLHK